MAVISELSFPLGDDPFEEMCFELFKAEWNDPNINRLGGPGQKQFGLDVIGQRAGVETGIQCKHFPKKAFTLKTVEDDVAKADAAADVDIEHLIFATTAPNKTDTVLAVRKLSKERQRAGKFTVQVMFWNELSSLIRQHPSIARDYIPGYPGGTLLAVKEAVEANLEIAESERSLNANMRSEVAQVLPSLAELAKQIQLSREAAALPSSQGTEAEPLIARQLDLAREKLLVGKPDDAIELLDNLGEPDLFRDRFSQFRWHTNRAAAHLALGNKTEAAREYLKSVPFQPDLEKAWRNKAHAHLLLDENENAIATCAEGLKGYPESSAIWALLVAARDRNGDTEPERGVPVQILATNDVLFTLSNVRYKQKRFEEAYDLMRSCVEGDAPSIDTKRMYLATALGWAAADPVAAHMGQLSEKQSTGLRHALAQLEPLEKTLVAVQGDEASFELTGNITSALLLLDDITRARAITNSALVRHPLSECLLRIRLGELEERKDHAGLRAFTEGRLNELPSSTLVGLAESAANDGELERHLELADELNRRELPEYQRLDLAILTVHARWVSGDQAQALVDLRAHLAAHPTHVMGLVALTRMLSASGDAIGASQTRDRAVRAVEQSATTAEILQVADVLYDTGERSDAVAMYGRVVKVIGDNGLSRRYLVALIDTDNRRLALEGLNSLSPEVRNQSEFRRIESNLARRMGDWARMRELTKLELDEHPKEAEVGLAYVGALHRIPGAEAELFAYLSQDPVFDGMKPLAEVELAKYQVAKGLHELAQRRLYKLYRDRPNDTEVAGHFLFQITMGQTGTSLNAPTEVAPGTAVTLHSGGTERTILIDVDDSASTSWAELTGSTSDLAENLSGKRLGDAVSLTNGVTIVDYRVDGLSSVYAFAAERAHKLISSAADVRGPMMSVSFQAEDGTLDIEPMLNETRRKTEATRQRFDVYTAHKFPLTTLAMAMGAQSFELMLDWPGGIAPLFVGIGTADERDTALALIRTTKKRYVVDPATLTELVVLGLLREIVSLTGKLLVSTTSREEILTALDNHRRVGGARFSVHSEGDKYIRTEISAEQISFRVQFLEDVLGQVDDYCEVTPVVGPATRTATHESLGHNIEFAVLDSVYLALERDAVFLSDDGGLRAMLPELGLPDTVNVQAMLMAALERRALDDARYVRALVSKLARNHRFISVRTQDLLHLCRATPAAIDDAVMLVLHRFEDPNVDIESAMRVVGEWIVSILGICRPEVTKAYLRRTLAALTEGRPEYAKVIYETLGHLVRRRLALMPKKQGVSLTRILAPILMLPSGFTTTATRVQELTVVAVAARSLIQPARSTFRAVRAYWVDQT